MNNYSTLTEGEILLLLVRRSGMEAKDIAEKLNIHPGHLSKLFKSEKLTSKIKRGASDLFGVPLDIFRNASSENFPDFNFTNEPIAPYKTGKEPLTAAEVLRYLEEKDKAFELERSRHHDERSRLLVIIENLSKSK